jgi:hypothetical protein
MKDDPTITRIRKTRHNISKKCGHDPKKIVDYYIKLQKKHKERFLTKETFDKLLMKV